MVKAVTSDKGGITEEALASYFRHAGFFAMRGVPFRHDGEDFTDIDVWLYERGGSLERRRFIVDSKNKARPKLVERLLWTAGLRDALGVDGGFVASSNIREANRRLARRIRISVIDVQALGTGGVENFINPDRLSREELNNLVADVDRQHESKVWREQINDVLAGLLTSFGGGGANIALRAARFYAEQSLAASPGSIVSEVAIRLFYLSAALAAVGLDFVAAQTSFQPSERRRTDVENAVRFGSDHDETKNRLELAIQLARQYLPNGNAIANQLTDKIISASNAIPADIIAEVVSKMVGKGSLFEASRSLESASHLRDLPGFGELSAEAKSFTGAVLDFNGIDRERFAKILVKGDRTQTASEHTRSLFEPHKPDQ